MEGREEGQMNICIGGMWDVVTSNVLGFLDLPKTKVFTKSGKRIDSAPWECGVA